jgi:hypothetical protein
VALCYRAAFPVRRLLLAITMGAVVLLSLLGAGLATGSSAHLRRIVIQRAALLGVGDRRLGTLAGTDTVRGAIVLRPRNDAALTRFIASVTDPHSATFDHYLPAGAFAARFGPTTGARAAVAAALRDEGLQVDASSTDGLIVPFSGTAADADALFSTSIHTVALSDGAIGRATSTPVSLPSSIAASVAAVVGLNDTVTAHRIASPSASPTGARATRVSGARAATVSAMAAGAAPHPCAAASADAVKNNGLTDDAVAGAYGAGGLYGAGDTGVGQHIAVYELEPFLRSDVRTFDRCYFGSAGAAAMMGRLHVVGVDGGAPHGTGSGEASLDVEDLSALAPGATIDVYVGPSANAYDSLDEYAEIVDQDHDRVVSTSWGLCEAAMRRGEPGQQEAENLLFQQAAAQGQTIFAAAGDSGSDDCSGHARTGPGSSNPVAVDDPASQPYVVGVGGTAITDATPGHVAEHAWNDGAVYGAGGGGISDDWAMTAWQRSARIRGLTLPGDRAWNDGDHLEQAAGFTGGYCDTEAGDGAGTPCRLVPDVSAQADEFTGAVTIYSREYASARHHRSGWSTVGGTSSAAPIWASSLALIDASPACAAAGESARGVGFAAPLLYEIASDPARDAASFTDVRTGDNDLYGLDDGRVFTAGPGYDLTTGLGSPILSGATGTAGLADYACELAATGPRPAVSAVTPSSGSVAGGQSLTIHGSGFESGGRSQVANVQIGSERIPAAELHVLGTHTITLRSPAARRALPPASSGDGSAAADVIVSLTDGASSAPGAGSVYRFLDTVASPAAVPTVQEISPVGGFSGGGGSVTIRGTGFQHATAVSIGGIRVPGFHIVGSDEITLSTPPQSTRTRCVALPRHGVYRGDTAANDICQVYVRVLGPRGDSPTTRIRPPLEGSTATDFSGVPRAVSSCHCEVVQADDEYDYVPRPHVDSVSTDDGRLALADEHGGTVITVHGSGLNPLTLAYADFGDPRRYTSETQSKVFETGTEIQIRAPHRKVSAGPARVAFSVRTLGGRSAPRMVTYAGVPAITSVVNADNSRNLGGLYGGPDTGGTPLRVSGRGLGSQVLYLVYLQPGNQPFSVGTQYQFRVDRDHGLRTATVAENPAIVALEACTVTGCTPSAARNRFWLYAAGAPSISAVTPSTGPAGGGTVATIKGENLGCAISANFGVSAAPSITGAKTMLSCGSAETLRATAPPGTVGQTVPVTVQTAESFYTGSAPVSVATFSYH